MRATLRWLVPALVVVGWMVVAAQGGPYFGRLGEVQSQSASDFLPASAESTRVREIQAALSDAPGVPTIAVFESVAGLDAAALAAIGAQLNAIRSIDGVATASPAIPSAERSAAGQPLAAAAFILVEGDDLPAMVEEVRAATAVPPAGVDTYITGPAGFAADLTAAFEGIDTTLLFVALAAVLVILLIVYRSPILPLVVLFSSVSALAASVVAVYWMAKAGWIVLNGQAQGILFILVVGAATDYALLLVSRYRDALREEPDARRALAQAWRGVVEPIAASAGTVIAGLLCLLISDLNSNKALGPVAAVGIVFAVLASLTFLPAVLALIGRPAFWPVVPRAGTIQRERPTLWARVAGLVSRRGRVLWVGTALVLLVLAALTPTFEASGVAQEDILVGESEAVAGQAVLERYFPAGSGAPVAVIAPAADTAAVIAFLEADSDLTDVEIGAGPAMVGGREVVEVVATLTMSPDSAEALAVIGRIREGVRAISPDALVGGSTATSRDSLDTATRDLWTIIPLVLVVITLILMALLRSVLAPVLLVATTLLSFLATLGLSALFFNGPFGFPGADPAVPLFAFVFLVALGIDYNIFLSTRIREEALRHGTRPGVLRGLTVTGGVITSAGIVLAATFAALSVIPVLFLLQIAFLVAVGVLIDALLVRSVLVPGLFHDIGRRIWWPARRPD